jgi:hypothetical protein
MPGSIHVGFVVDKVTLGQGFLRVLRFYFVKILPLSLSNSYHLGKNNVSVSGSSSET